MLENLVFDLQFGVLLRVVPIIPGMFQDNSVLPLKSRLGNLVAKFLTARPQLVLPGLMVFVWVSLFVFI